MKPLPTPHPDTPTIGELERALDALAVDTQPAWGKLDATGMCEHSSRFIDLYLGRVPVALPIRLIARALGPLFLKRMLAASPRDTPKNLQTLKPLRFEAAPTADVAAFEEARASLRRGLGEVTALAGVVAHPLYGATDAETCRALVRHHTAHHFHQFQLLS